MGKFTDSEGNEVEAFTQEELDAKVKEASETAIKDKETVETEKAGLQKTIDENKEKITGLESKGKSVDDLRKINEGLEKQLKDKDETNQKAMDELKSKIPDPLDVKIKAAAKGDEELAGKLKTRLGAYKEDPADDAEFGKRLSEAVLLESQENIPDVLEEVASSAGGEGAVAADKAQTTTDPNLIKNFGFKDEEEYKKYEDKAKADGIIK